LSVDPEYTVLRLSYRGATLEELKRALSLGLDDKRINSLIGAMKGEGLIDILNISTEEYDKCVERVSNDKRIKDPEKYCLRRYPMRILVKITEYGIVKLIEKAYQHYSRFISPLLACVEVAREFREWIGAGVMVFDIDDNTCRLATELINRELYLRVRDYPRWESIPLVIVWQKRSRYIRG